jgi:hypothetical protein
VAADLRRYTRDVTPPPPAEPRDALRRAAAALPRVILVALFGSRAVGRPRADSDLDLAVLLEADNTADRREVDVAFARAAAMPTDVVYLNDAPPQLRFEIARSGVLLFERTRGLWVRERARAMVDWWDWAPIARRIHTAAMERLRQEAR